MASDREWRYVPHVEVASYEAQGWVDTGESVGHHGAHSHMMYRYADDDPMDSVEAGDDDPMDNVNVMATAVSAEGGEITLTIVTDLGAQAFVLTADKAASLGGKLFRSMSDLVPARPK